MKPPIFSPTRLFSPVVLFLGSLLSLEGASSGPFTYQLTPEYGPSWERLSDNTVVEVVSYDRDAVGRVIVPETIEGKRVTSIGYQAFAGCARVTEIILPASITRLDTNAFIGCSALTGIHVDEGNENFVSQDGVLFDQPASQLLRYPSGKEEATYAIPEGVTTIRYSAFEGSVSLTEINLTEDIKEIHSRAFADCPALLSIEVAEGNEHYASMDGVLFNAMGTELVRYPAGRMGAHVIPDGVSLIESEAYADASLLTEITFPEGLKTLGWNAFSGCRSLTEIILPSSLAHVNGGAFANCTSLTQVSFPETLQALGNETFSGCHSLKEIVIPNGITRTGYRNFVDCGALTKVSFPESLLTIDDDAFLGCQALTSVAIPQNVTRIADSAFQGCSGITEFIVDTRNKSFDSVDGVLFSADRSRLILLPAAREGSYTVPQGVSEIDRSAFGECLHLEDIHVAPNNATYVSVDGVLFNADLTTLLRYPPGRVGGYAVPEGVTSLGEGSGWGWWGFEGDSSPPNGVGAFENCHGLTNIHLPEGVLTIGEGTFMGCSNLPTITIPKNVTHIGRFAFHACPSLAAIHVDPMNESYSSLDGVLFNASQTYLIRYPEGKSGDSYAIPYGVESVAAEQGSGECGVGHVVSEGAFENVRLNSVTVPESVRSIADSAFLHTANPLAVVFLGDAPWSFQGAIYGATKPELTVYYSQTSSGFSESTWGYSTRMIEGGNYRKPYEPRITSIGFDEEGWLELEWVSKIDTLYAIEASTDLETWTIVATQIESGGALTGHALNTSNDTGKAFYRTKEVLPLEANFDQGADGWTSDGVTEDTQWEMASVEDSESEELNQVWAINPGIEYAPNGAASLRSPLVDLSKVNRWASLSFRYQIDSVLEVEGGQLRFVGEDGAIIHTHEEPFTGQSDGWTDFRLSLPADLQDTTFSVEFLFLSDEDEHVGQGWMINDVLIN